MSKVIALITPASMLKENVDKQYKLCYNKECNCETIETEKHIYHKIEELSNE